MCFDPVSAMMMIGTGARIFGTLSEGKEKEADHRLSALERERKLEQERQNHAIRRRRKQRDTARKIGAKIAQTAERGIAIDGSTGEALESSARDLDLQQQELDRDFSNRRTDMKFEASRFRLAGKRARRKSRFDAFAKAIDGGTRLVSGF